MDEQRSEFVQVEKKVLGDLAESAKRWQNRAHSVGQKRKRWERRAVAAEAENERLRVALGEAVEVIENCDRHVSLLAGERRRYERAKAALSGSSHHPS